MEWTVSAFEELDSTNTYLLARAEQGEPEGSVVWARYQTAGRGRLGRKWVAQPGGALLTSILLRPGGSIERAHVFTLAASCALALAVGEATGGTTPWLKWPNDLVVDDAKLAGALAETIVSASGELDALVIGLGCNLQPVPDGVTDAPTTSLRQLGSDISAQDLLAKLLANFSDWLALGDADVLELAAARTSTIGRQVSVDTGGEVVVGTAIGLNQHGHLRVASSAGERSFAVGDVVHLR